MEEIKSNTEVIEKITRTQYKFLNCLKKIQTILDETIKSIEELNISYKNLDIPTELSEQELLELQDYFNSGWNFIARDLDDEELFLFILEPIQYDKYWVSSSREYALDSNKFKFIKSGEKFFIGDIIGEKEIKSYDWF